ncbi:MAG TPA: sigma 54-interacting transcriptional regulator [Vicinamibacterales bacterium]
MGSRSNGVGMTGAAAGANQFQQLREDWRLLREAHRDLQIVWRQRTNMLLLGAPGATRIVLDMLELDVREPILRWRPGQPLQFPPPDRTATLILHDVDKMTCPDQHAVLRCLDQTAGKVRVVSTTVEPLWPRVQRGVFNEVLYYRLNTVCLGAPASES